MIENAYKKKIESVEEIQEISFNILCYFDNFCRKYNLKYSLAGGTLLGAVRHKGFIPWDDDVDVIMPRDDYEKFLELQQSNKNNRYLVINRSNTKNIPFVFSKMIDTNTVLHENIPVPYDSGVFIDIFPVDGLPESKREIKKHIKHINFLKDKLSITKNLLNVNHGSFPKRIIKKILFNLFGKKINMEDLLDEIDAEIKKYDFSVSNHVAFLALGYGMKEVNEKKAFDNLKELNFNGTNFFVVGNYDSYLHSLFGNYLKLPPKKMQATHHSFNAYWKDDTKFS